MKPDINVKLLSVTNACVYGSRTPARGVIVYAQQELDMHGVVLPTYQIRVGVCGLEGVGSELIVQQGVAESDLAPTLAERKVRAGWDMAPVAFELAKVYV